MGQNAHSAVVSFITQQNTRCVAQDFPERAARTRRGTGAADLSLNGKPPEDTLVVQTWGLLRHFVASLPIDQTAVVPTVYR